MPSTSKPPMVGMTKGWQQPCALLEHELEAKSNMQGTHDRSQRMGSDIACSCLWHVSFFTSFLTKFRKPPLLFDWLHYKTPTLFCLYQRRHKLGINSLQHTAPRLCCEQQKFLLNLKNPQFSFWQLGFCENSLREWNHYFWSVLLCSPFQMTPYKGWKKVIYAK